MKPLSRGNRAQTRRQRLAIDQMSEEEIGLPNPFEERCSTRRFTTQHGKHKPEIQDRRRKTVTVIRHPRRKGMRGKIPSHDRLLVSPTVAGGFDKRRPGVRHRHGRTGNLEKSNGVCHPPMIPGGCGLSVVFEPVEGVLGRRAAGEHGHGRRFPGGVAVPVHQPARRLRWRPCLSRVQAFGKFAAWEYWGPCDDRGGRRILEEERRGRGTVMRKGDENAATIDQGDAREVLTRRRNRRVADRRVDGTARRAMKHAPVVIGQREQTSDIRWCIANPAQPARGNRDLAATNRSGNGGHPCLLNGDVPAGRAARPAVAARIWRVKGQPECGHRTDGLPVCFGATSVEPLSSLELIMPSDRTRSRVPVPVGSSSRWDDHRTELLG
jgi:hypothetical protein